MTPQVPLFALKAEAPMAALPDFVDAPALVAQLGSEVARALSSALERVSTLATTGQIDREGLRGLRDEIESARRAGIMGQQLVRLSSDRVALAQERVDLSGMLREALQQRQRETRARAMEVQQLSLADITMVSDAALMFSLIETMLDWCFEHARTRVVFKLEAKQSPTRARLRCVFLRQPAEGVSLLDTTTGRDPAMSTLSWLLLKQTAQVLGLSLRRLDTADRCEMRLSFPGADTDLTSTLQGLEAEDISVYQAQHAQPLAGRHLVVLSARRETRTVIRDVLKPTGSMIDFVATVEEARQLFEDSLPHAVIYDAVLAGDHFDRLRANLRQDAPQLVFIEIAEQGRDFQVLEADGVPYASVGRDGLAESLPAALLFELSRHG